MKRHTQTRAGALVLTLMMTLLFFSLLAGVQALVVVQTSHGTRALAASDARAEYRRRAVLAVREGLQGTLDRRHGASLSTRISVALEALGCGDGVVQVAGIPQVLELGAWMPAASPMNRGEFPARVDAGLVLDFPELRFGAGQGIDVVGTLSLQGRHPDCSGQAGQAEVFELEARILGVSLGACPERVYQLPSELGLAMGVETIGESSPESSLLLTKGRLPYHFRTSAALAAVYARLFSDMGMGCLRMAAGEQGFGLWREGRAVGALSSLFETAGAGRCRINLAGATVPRVCMVSIPDASIQLELGDEGRGGGMNPVLVVLTGAPGVRVSVVLGECRRPVLLIGVNVFVDAAPGTVWAGGLMLCPASSFAAGLSGLRLSHASIHGRQVPPSGALICDLTRDQTLEALYPRIYYAAVREVHQ